MTLCVIDGKQCQCQPDEGVPCVEGTPAQVQAAMCAEVMKYRKDAKRYLTMLENLETLVLRTKTGATLTLKAARRGAEANRRGADATLDGLGAA